MKFLLTGLTSFALFSGTHALGMTLETDLLDGVDGGSITKGALTASLKHRHEEVKSRLSNQIKSSTAFVTVKVNGEVVGTEVWIDEGHTIDNEVTYHESTKFCAAIILPMRNSPEDYKNLYVADKSIGRNIFLIDYQE